MKEPIRELSQCEDKILEIIDEQLENEVSRGDLQGMIEGQIRIAYLIGKEQALKEAIKTGEKLL